MPGARAALISSFFGPARVSTNGRNKIPNHGFQIHPMKRLLPFLSVVYGFLLGGCCSTHHATRWEYRMANSIAEVNQFAGQGWTVVSFDVPSQGGPNQYLLKHAKP